MTTLTQFIESFNTQFYAATTVDSMGWTNEEICEFLNSAQLQLVEELAAMGNVGGISNLVAEESIVKNANISKYTIPVEAPNNYFYYLTGYVTLNKTNPSANGSIFPLEKISIVDVPKFTASVDNTTFFKNPKIALGNNYSKSNNTGEMFTVVVDSFTSKINSVVINYIIKPKEFKSASGNNSTITNINESLHNRIVLIAVEKAVRTMLGTQQSSQ